MTGIGLTQKDTTTEERDPAMELMVLINALAKTSILEKWAECRRMEALDLIDQITTKETTCQTK